MTRSCKSATAKCTSHVTRHTSHVTRPTSHVTRHTSHVTRHASHVTRHTSHVTRHTSHVTRHSWVTLDARHFTIDISKTYPPLPPPFHYSPPPPPPQCRHGPSLLPHAGRMQPLPLDAATPAVCRTASLHRSPRVALLCACVFLFLSRVTRAPSAVPRMAQLWPQASQGWLQGGSEGSSGC